MECKALRVFACSVAQLQCCSASCIMHTHKRFGPALKKTHGRRRNVQTHHTCPNTRPVHMQQPSPGVSSRCPGLRTDTRCVLRSLALTAHTSVTNHACRRCQSEQPAHSPHSHTHPQTTTCSASTPHTYTHTDACRTCTPAEPAKQPSDPIPHPAVVWYAAPVLCDHSHPCKHRNLPLAARQMPRTRPAFTPGARPRPLLPPLPLPLPLLLPPLLPARSFLSPCCCQRCTPH